MVNWNKLNKSPYKYIEQLETDEIIEIVNIANKHYHNNESIISDSVYDLIITYLDDNRDYQYSNVGSEVVVDKAKVKLPVYMGSMNKYKPKDDLTKWSKKYNHGYMISDKLDGSSGLYIRNEDGTINLYTRGNGKIGQDVSYLQDYINLPKLSKFKGRCIVRGEFIISKKNWLKYEKKFSNSRNLVSGLINSKYIKNPDYLRDIDFVAYEMIEPVLKPKKQFNILTLYGFDVVFHKYYKSFTKDQLSKILMDRRESGNYEIDGIIITDNYNHTRETEKNPKHSFAFKIVLMEQLAETTVLDIDWHVSSWGVLKPVVKLQPVFLEGVTIRNVTGINAKFIMDNKIAPGAILQIVRSGSVIPKIHKVITPAAEGQLPDCKFYWNKSKIDIMVDKEEISDEMMDMILVKQILRFMNAIGVVGFKRGKIKAVIQSDKLNSIQKLLKARKSYFLEIEGFQDKSASKILRSIKESFKKAPMVKIMSGSSCFGLGFGEKKLQLVLDNIPDIFTNDYSQDELISKINKINGFSNKTTNKFINCLDKFKQFLKSIRYNYDNMILKPVEETVSLVSNKLVNKKFLFSGFRSKILEDIIKKNGGQVVDKFNKEISYLVVNNLEKISSKMKQANKHNIPIITEINSLIN